MSENTITAALRRLGYDGDTMTCARLPLDGQHAAQ
jgi:hypothetical protein